MRLVAQLLVLLVAVEHAWFLILEMFLFTRPIGLKTFGVDEVYARRAAPLMANQGLYNGFLVAGLVWSVIASEPFGFRLKIFFLGCVIVAGIFGGATVNRRILYLQAGPALLALVLVFLA